MINFCQSPFVSEAHASLIHQDGFEADNLFSLDSLKKRKGYQVERFVRPPVAIDITFKLPVTVYYIIVEIGLHDDKEKCKVEFFASNATNSRCLDSFHHLQGDAANGRFCGSFIFKMPSAMPAQSSGCCTLFHNPITKQLGSTTPSKVLGSQVCERLVCQQITSQPLKPINELTTTTNLTVCIKQYTSSRALHVKCLEVWGLPSKYSTAAHLKCFENGKETCILHQNNNASLSSVTMLYNTSSCNSGSSQSVDYIESPSFKANESLIKDPNPVPDTFIDRITYEIMVLPYLLPSGYHVDQSTVEKCQETDLLYGRPPSDPFTGIPYTDTVQPEFCPRLKSEIDSFASASNCSTTGKTVGSSTDITNHRSSSLVAGV